MLGFDATFKALADPTRRAILHVLRDGALTAGEISARLGVAPSALSFHLRALKGADLVSDQRRGQFIEYRLNASVLDEVIGYLMAQFGGRSAADAVGSPAAEEARR